jgi:hypothetical protein
MWIKAREKNTIRTDVKEITTPSKKASKNKSNLTKRRTKTGSQQVSSPTKLIKPSIKGYSLRAPFQISQFKRDNSLPL